MLVPKACDGDLETRWERLLADDELLRETMGPPDADAERVEALRRTGDIEGARGIVVQMFHRAVVDDLPGFDAGELLEQLESMT
ncbi:MAG: hypothetical protein M5U31_16220 [Acidimicrobiia bacterium]|nr:hypothetical protein [Acidimicrobiia bacterium]